MSGRLTTLAVERRVDEILQRHPNSIALRDRLGHDDDEHILLRIDPERRPAGARPVHLADRTISRPFARLGSNGKSEAEPAAFCREVIAPRLHTGSGPDLVCTQHGNRLLAEIPSAGERAAVDQHLREMRVVFQRRDHSAATGLPFLHKPRIIHDEVIRNGPVVGKRLGHQRFLGGIGYFEARVFHRERTQQPVFLELKQRHSRSDFDHPAQDVGRVAVVPCGAGLIGQRQCGYARGERGVVHVAGQQPRVGIRLLDQTVPEEPVGYSGCLTHQVANGDRVLRGNQMERGNSAGRVVLDADFRVGEFRNVFRYRVIQVQLSVFHQHQSGNRRDRFAHRVDAEDAARGHRLPVDRIAQTEASGIDRPAIALDQHHGARDLPLGDLVLQIMIDARETFARKSLMSGTRTFGQIGGREERQRGNQAERGIPEESRYGRCSTTAYGWP